MAMQCFACCVCTVQLLLHEQQFLGCGASYTMRYELVVLIPSVLLAASSLDTCVAVVSSLPVQHINKAQQTTYLRC